MSGLICTHKSLGLINDANILKNISSFANISLDILEYDFLQIKTIQISKSYKYIFFIEHICQQIILNNNAIYVFIPNIELMNSVDNQCIKNKLVNYIFAKTNLAYEVLFKLYKDFTCIHKTLWTSIDRHVPNIEKDYMSFLHIKGCSRFKNSQLLLNLWLQHPEWPHLTIVHHGNINQNGYLELKESFKYKSNITIYQYKLENIELNILMNKCGVHICPSEMEGFGHYINEGISTGAILITPDGPPMNELNKHGICFEVDSFQKLNLGVISIVLEKYIENSINVYINMSLNEILNKSKLSRDLYCANYNMFVSKIVQFYNSSSV